MTYKNIYSFWSISALMVMHAYINLEKNLKRDLNIEKLIETTLYIVILLVLKKLIVSQVHSNNYAGWPDH